MDPVRRCRWLDRTAWPLGKYFACLGAGELSLVIFTPALDGVEANWARAVLWLIILVFGVGRYVFALARRENSRTWVFYCVVWLLLTPIWLLLEPVVSFAGRGAD